MGSSRRIALAVFGADLQIRVGLSVCVCDHAVGTFLRFLKSVILILR